MMYQKSGNYVACVKVDGKILREDADGIVNLPFGATYSIFLKNLNSVRSVAKVTVDGVEASGHGIIVPANGSIDLERFLKRDGDMNRGNKFKFIERTAGIEEHKGIGAEDGLIRIEFLTEVQPPVHRTTVVEHVQHSYLPPAYWYRYPYWGYPYQPLIGNGMIYGGLNQSVTTCGALGSVAQNAQNLQGAQASGSVAMNMAETSFSAGATASMGASSAPTRILRSSAMRAMRPEVERSPGLNNVGITVPGAQSNQKFTHGEWFQTEKASHVIVLQLRGAVGGKPVAVPFTVKSKKKCSTCGTANKAHNQFCGKCGTVLEIL